MCWDSSSTPVVRVRRPELPGCLRAVRGHVRRHPDVDHREIRRVLGHCGAQGDGVPDDRDDGVSFVLQEADQSLPEQHRVVGDHHSQPRHVTGPPAPWCPAERAVDDEPAADGCDPIVQGGQPDVGHPAHPVVAHLDGQSSAVPADPDVDPVRPGVLERVRHRLGHDEVRRVRARLVDLGQLPHLQHDRHRAAGPQLVQRRTQAVVQPRGSHTVREPAELPHRLLEVCHRGVDLGRILAVETALQAAQPDPRGDDPLLRAVVELALEPPPLLGRRLRQPRATGLDVPQCGAQLQTQPADLQRHPGRRRQLGDPAAGARRVPAELDPGDHVPARLHGEPGRLRDLDPAQVDPSAPGSREGHPEVRVALGGPQDLLDLLRLATPGTHVARERRHRGHRNVPGPVHDPADEDGHVAVQRQQRERRHERRGRRPEIGSRAQRPADDEHGGAEDGRRDRQGDEPGHRAAEQPVHVEQVVPDDGHTDRGRHQHHDGHQVRRVRRLDRGAQQLRHPSGHQQHPGDRPGEGQPADLEPPALVAGAIGQNQAGDAKADAEGDPGDASDAHEATHRSFGLADDLPVLEPGTPQSDEHRSRRRGVHPRHAPPETAGPDAVGEHQEQRQEARKVDRPQAHRHLCGERRAVRRRQGVRQLDDLDAARRPGQGRSDGRGRTVHDHHPRHDDRHQAHRSRQQQRPPADGDRGHQGADDHGGRRGGHRARSRRSHDSW